MVSEVGSRPRIMRTCKVIPRGAWSLPGGPNESATTGAVHGES